jgi:hypothetical protein
MRLLERRIQHMRNSALLKLHARLRERSEQGHCQRFFELVDTEVFYRRRDDELIPRDEPHDYADEQVLYDRHNPNSPYGY